MSLMLDQILRVDARSSVTWAELDEATRIDVIKLGRLEGIGLQELADKVGATTGMLGGFMDRHGLRIGSAYEISLAGRTVRANRKRGKQSDSGFEQRIGFLRNGDARLLADTRNAGALQAFKPDQNEHAKLLTMAELEDHQCRWPIDTEKGIRFCGSDVQEGQSYCARHHKQSRLSAEEAR